MSIHLHKGNTNQRAVPIQRAALGHRGMSLQAQQPAATAGVVRPRAAVLQDRVANAAGPHKLKLQQHVAARQLGGGHGAHQLQGPGLLEG